MPLSCALTTLEPLQGQGKDSGRRTQHTRSPAPLPGVCMVSPHVPALLTKPCSAQARTGTSSAQSVAHSQAQHQSPPKGAHTHTHTLLAAVLPPCSRCLAAAMLPECCAASSPQHWLSVLLAGSLMPVILELAQAQVFMTWEDKENSHQRLQDQTHSSPIPALANASSSQHSCSPAA